MQNVLKKKKKRRKITTSEQEQEEPAIKEDQVDGHQLTGEKRNKELPGHKKQTVTELEMVEKERKKRKKQKKKEKQMNVQAEMEVPDPEEQTKGKTKKRKNKLQTRRVRDEAMSSWKKRKNKLQTRRVRDEAMSSWKKRKDKLQTRRVRDEAMSSWKKRKNKLQTRRVRDEAMSSWKKRKNKLQTRRVRDEAMSSWKKRKDKLQTRRVRDEAMSSWKKRKDKLQTRRVRDEVMSSWKKRKNKLQTRRVRDEAMSSWKKRKDKLQTRRVRDEVMSSWKKRKNYNDRETKEGMDSGLSASAVDVSDVRVPVEARKSKKKHKNRQTKLEEGAESRQTVLRLADDPEIIELYIKAVEGGENVVTEVQKKVKEKRKRKKEIVGEIQLNVCPDETELPGILEQTERKWKTTRLKTQPDGGAVEGSRRRKRQPGGGAVEGSRRRKIQPDGGAVEDSRRRKIQRCRESDTGMDSVPSMSEITDLTASNDNGTHDSGPEPEKDGPHTTMVETSAQQRRRCLKDKHLSEKEWRAMNELKEFVPNIASRPVKRIRAMIKYDLDRFKEFRRQGISLRTGRYSAQENKQLMSNINDFLALTGIENAAKLFHSTRYKDELTEIQKLKSHHRFPERIAEGIPRPWGRIYSRGGRKMFDGSSYKGSRQFSQDELASLKKLQMLYGNKWVKISQLTGRSEVPLMRRFSQMYANLGSWSEEELKRLMEVVRDHLLGQVEPGSGPATIRKDKLYNNIPWTDVCRRVGFCGTQNGIWTTSIQGRCENLKGKSGFDQSVEHNAGGRCCIC
ncbi:transcription termination factor 1-like isoform X1 [Salvelinus alpinus]|uniref:transcription termination factor 1-like isoform X1 n=1 Tax=Salvelinus alpinus TaxID=8036 RepID=UPI0039FB9F6C